MKFDLLCDIMLEAKKDEKFARMIIGNDAPVFSAEDVLRDPNDPSKGLRTYLTHRDSKSIGEDHERLARRAVRRINWIAKASIKKLGSREISLNKLNDFIVSLLDKYQTKVMGYSKPDKLNTAREARIIGNLLLPPTKWTPQAKSVFIPATETLPGQPKQKVDSEQIVKDFNTSADDFATLFDPDLIATIKDIVRGVSADTGEEEDMTDVYESAESVGGVPISQILKDPKIKGIYDPRVVRKVVKSMLDIGSLISNEEGNLTLPEEGQEAWRASADKASNNTLDTEEIPTEQDMEDLSSQEDTDVDLEEELPDDEEYSTGPDAGDSNAGSRLGYDAPEERDIEIEGEYEEIDDEEEEEEKEESWY